MSLSFVSKAIQTSRDDGGYDECPVENADGAASRSAVSFDHKPLFEQLRANQEQEEEERAELQRSIMRGTLALDEEDCAHLDALEKQRARERSFREQETAEELAAFRAAKENLLEQHTYHEMLSGERRPRMNDLREATTKRAAGSSAIATKLIPVVKKPKISPDSQRTSVNTESQSKTQTPGPPEEVEDGPAQNEKCHGLNSLLSGYSSSDAGD